MTSGFFRRETDVLGGLEGRMNIEDVDDPVDALPFLSEPATESLTDE